jgi:hypothetical protein
MGNGKVWLILNVVAVMVMVGGCRRINGIALALFLAWRSWILVTLVRGLAFLFSYSLAYLDLASWRS